MTEEKTISFSTWPLFDSNSEISTTRFDQSDDLSCCHLPPNVQKTHSIHPPSPSSSQLIFNYLNVHSNPHHSRHHHSRSYSITLFFLCVLLLTCLLHSLSMRIMFLIDVKHHYYESHGEFFKKCHLNDGIIWMVLAFPSTAAITTTPSTAWIEMDYKNDDTSLNNDVFRRRRRKNMTTRNSWSDNLNVQDDPLVGSDDDLTEPMHTSPFKRISFPYLDSYSTAVSHLVEQQIEVLTNISLNMAQDDFDECKSLPWCDTFKFKYRYYWNNSASSQPPPPQPYYSSIRELFTKINNDFNEEMQRRKENLGAILDKTVALFEIHVYSDIPPDSCQSFSLDFVNQNLTRKLYMHMKFVGKEPTPTVDCGMRGFFETHVKNFSFTLQNFHVRNFIMPQGPAVVIDCDLGGFLRLPSNFFSALVNVVNKGEIDFEGEIIFLRNYRSLIPRVTYSYTYRARALILYNSTIHMANFFIPSQNRVWVVNSQFYLLDSVDVEEPGQVVVMNSSISCSMSQELNVFPFLTISYSRFVSINLTTIDRCVGKTVLRIEQCIDVVMNELKVTNNYNPQNGGIVHLKNCRNVNLLSSQFIRNIAMESSLVLDSVLSGSVTFSEFIENESFTDGGALTYKFSEVRSALTQISSSTFLRNKALGKGGAIRAEKASIDVVFCKLLENSAMMSGGALYTTAFTYIEGSEFYGNTAISGGGAIYGANTLAMIRSSLRNNSILSQTISLCGKESCDGTGGALFLNVPSVDKQFKMINVTFMDNRAVRGGAIGLTNCTFHDLEDVTIVNNAALYAGGGIFYFGFRPHEIPQFQNINNNMAGTYGHNMASPIKTTQWVYQIKGSTDTYSAQQGVRLYPGQLFSLQPTSKDIFGNEIGSLTEEFAIIMEDFRIRIYGKSRSLENMYLSVNQSSSLSSIPTSFTVTFFESSITIPLDLIQCPYQFDLVPAAYNSDYEFICKEHISIGSIVAIVIASTIASFSIFMSIVIVVGYVSCKVAKKVQYWRKRDQAEKEMEKRLLENQVIYSDEERQAMESSNSNSITKSKRGFIIGLDQIFIDKKIGEGKS